MRLILKLIEFDLGEIRDKYKDVEITLVSSSDSLVTDQVDIYYIRKNKI